MVRIMPHQTRRGAACAESPVLGLAPLAARQGQDLSRHSAASPTVHILAEGDRSAWRNQKPLHCVVVLDLDRDSEETPIGRKFLVTSATNAVDGTLHERHCRVAGIDRPE